MDLFKPSRVSDSHAARLEAEAGRLWDLFYRRNADRFFKDRHYFDREFPELLSASTVLEVGCGVGNTIFPLLELNPTVRLWACDFAPSAVALVHQHPAYGPASAVGRCTAFVADITADDLCAVGGVPAGGIDACTMVFVLSAIAPEAMPAALARVAACLHLGSRVLFRDYATGDLAAERLAAEGRQQQLSENFYKRWDGTRAFFFSEAFLVSLFAAAGFACEYVRPHERVVENQKRGLSMQRRWLQAVFRYEGPHAAGVPAAVLAAAAAANGANWSNETGGAGGGKSVEQGQQQAELLNTGLAELDLGGTELRVRLPTHHEAMRLLQTSKELADLLLTAPSLGLGLGLHSNVVELGCGAAALPSLATLRWCGRTVATDGNAAALEVLRCNAAAAGPQFVIERLRLHRLSLDMCCGGQQREGEQQWQQPHQQLRQLLSAFPCGFDLVVSAASAPPAQLAAAAGALLSQQPQALALLLLDGPEVAARLYEAAEQHGLRRLAPWPAELAQAVQEASVDETAGSRFTLVALSRPPPQ